MKSRSLLMLFAVLTCAISLVSNLRAETTLDDPTDGFVMCLEQSYQFGTFGGTNCWGWTDSTGREYAFMGIAPGIVCVDVTGHRVVDTVLGPGNGCGSTLWREMKHYSHYFYAVSECTGTNQGLMIIDMQYLPDSLHFVKSFLPPGGGSVTCHEISIDTVKGYAYLVRSGYNGFRVLSLANPTNPVELTGVTTPYCHDMTAYNDTVWCAEGTNSSFSVWNMANKASPQMITRVTFPDGGFVHNLWPTDDRHYLASTQETAGRTVKFWDISNYANVQLAGTYLGPSALAHNAHWQGNKFFISHYESGVVAVDISNVSSPVQLSQFDTFAGENADFEGCWGVYPHTRSGRVYASNLDGKFFILTTSNVSVNNDTLVGDSKFTVPSAHVSSTVSLNNGGSIGEVVIPLDYNGPLNLVFDSLSVAGLRTSGWSKARIILGAPGSRREVWQISGPSIPAGTGPIAKVFFRVSAAAQPGDSSLVLLGPVLLTAASEGITSCYTFDLPTVPAVLKIPPPSPCCINQTGNVDGDVNDQVDIGDLTALVDNLFISFAPIPCPGEANTDGSGSPIPDVGDLTRLVDFLFISFTPLAPCQ